MPFSKTADQIKRSCASGVEWFYTRPTPRTASGVVNVFVAAFLVSWLQRETTVNDEFVWSKLLETKVSLWAIFYIFWLWLYTWGSFRNDHRLQRWNDQNYLEARMTETLWPKFMEMEKKRIEAGEVRSLEEAKKDLFE